MKPLLYLSCIIFLIAITTLSNAQNIITTYNGKKIIASSVYLTHSDIVFTDAQKQQEISDSKKMFQSVLFYNGLFITYADFQPMPNLVTGYNSTVNLVNGDFLTAEIVRITADSVIYISPKSSDTLFLAPEKIIEINYVNGVSEQFASNDSLFVQIQAPKPKTEKPNYTRNTSFYVGAAAGSINSWTVRNNSSSQNYHLKGFSGGITSYYDFSKNQSLNTSLIFASKGVGFKSDTLDFKLKLSYLEIPFSYQFEGGSDKFKLFGDVGFYFGFLVSAKAITSTPATLEENKITSQLKPVDFGISLGAGAKYFTASGCIFTGIRYEMALKSVNGSSSYNSGNFSYFSTGFLNRSYLLYAGYAVNLKSIKNRAKSGAK